MCRKTFRIIYPRLVYNDGFPVHYHHVAAKLLAVREGNSSREDFDFVVFVLGNVFLDRCQRHSRWARFQRFAINGKNLETPSGAIPSISPRLGRRTFLNIMASTPSYSCHGPCSINGYSPLLATNVPIIGFSTRYLLQNLTMRGVARTISFGSARPLPWLKQSMLPRLGDILFPTQLNRGVERTRRHPKRVRMNLYVSVIGILDGSTRARCSFPAVHNRDGSGRQLHTLLVRAKVLTDVGHTCVRSVCCLFVSTSIR